jgi:hypothetical protein
VIQRAKRELPVYPQQTKLYLHFSSYIISLKIEKIEVPESTNIVSITLPLRRPEDQTSPRFTCATRLKIPNLPCFRLHPAPPPAIPMAPPSPRHLRLLQRGGILRVKYATSRPTDYNCRVDPIASALPSASKLHVFAWQVQRCLCPPPRPGQAARRGGHHWPGTNVTSR